MYVGIPTKGGRLRCNAVSRVAVCFHCDIRSLNFSQLFIQRKLMNSIVYLVGAVVIIIAVLSFFGLR